MRTAMKPLTGKQLLCKLVDIKDEDSIRKAQLTGHRSIYQLKLAIAQALGPIYDPEAEEKPPYEVQYLKDGEPIGASKQNGPLSVALPPDVKAVLYRFKDPNIPGKAVRPSSVARDAIMKYLDELGALPPEYSK